MGKGQKAKAGDSNGWMDIHHLRGKVIASNKVPQQERRMLVYPCFKHVHTPTHTHIHSVGQTFKRNGQNMYNYRSLKQWSPVVSHISAKA